MENKIKNDKNSEFTKTTNLKNLDNKTNQIKDEDIKEVFKAIEKSFGKGSIFFLNDKDDQTIESISSGSFLIDQAIGVNGYPKGRIIEIYGPESSGKTTLGLHAIIEAQKQGKVGAFIDVEHSLDANYAKSLGMNFDKFLVSKPEYGEQALDILEMLVKSGLLSVIVLDSDAALVPKVELEGEMSDQSIGLQARMMSKALRKLSGIISKTKTIVIFINQLRERVGVIFGNPEITSGGKALKFFASLRIEVRRGEQIFSNGEANANKIKVKIVKNKLAAPNKNFLVTLNYNKGIDKYNEIFEMAVLNNIIDKAGVWYSYKSEKIGQGKKAVIEWMKINDLIYEEIKTQILININTKI